MFEIDILSPCESYGVKVDASYVWFQCDLSATR